MTLLPYTDRLLLLGWAHACGVDKHDPFGSFRCRNVRVLAATHEKDILVSI